jgi:hypothetical protein
VDELRHGKMAIMSGGSKRRRHNEPITIFQLSASSMACRADRPNAVKVSEKPNKGARS